MPKAHKKKNILKCYFLISNYASSQAWDGVVITQAYYQAKLAKMVNFFKHTIYLCSICSLTLYTMHVHAMQFCELKMASLKMPMTAYDWAKLDWITLKKHRPSSRLVYHTIKSYPARILTIYFFLSASQISCIKSIH